MRCCSVNELKAKEVISEKNGCRLGYVNDVEIDLQDGRLVALIIYGRTRFGFAAHDCDWRICWDDISVIGEDTILVHTAPPPKPPRPPKNGKNQKKNILDGLFQY